MPGPLARRYHGRARASEQRHISRLNNWRDKSYGGGRRERTASQYQCRTGRREQQMDISHCGESTFLKMRACLEQTSRVVDADTQAKCTEVVCLPSFICRWAQIGRISLGRDCLGVVEEPRQEMEVKLRRKRAPQSRGDYRRSSSGEQSVRGKAGRPCSAALPEGNPRFQLGPIGMATTIRRWVLLVNGQQVTSVKRSSSVG